MARQALTVAGYVAGFFLPGGPAVWGAIGAAVGSYVDPQVIKGPRLGEGQENTASEGGFRPIVLGKGAVGVCMIHQGPLIKRTIRQRQSKGSGTETEQDRFYRTMAFGLGESAYPDDGVILLRLWIDGKLRYDVTPTSQIAAESAEFAQEFTFYPGNNSQDPDPDLEAYMGAGNVPSYRGGAPYIVFPNYDVTSRDGKAPQIKAEIASAGQTAPLVDTVWARFGGFRVSLDGQNWSAWKLPPPVNASNLIPTPERYILYGSSGSYYWTDDAGDNYTAATGAGPSGSGSGQLGQCSPDGQTIIISGGVQNCRKSVNGGLQFVEVGKPAQGCFQTLYLNGAWVAVQDYRLFRSPDEGGTWPLTYNVGAGYTLVCAWSNYFEMMVGGTQSGVPFVGRSTDAGDLTPETLPTFASATQVTAVHYGVIDGEPYWVVGTDSGELAYRSSGAWILANDALPDRVTSITFNGTGFSAVSRDNGTGTQRQVTVYSANAADWDVTADETVAESTFPMLASFPPVGGASSAEKVLLSTIATWLHDRVDVPSTKIDVSELTDLVEGVVLAGDYSAADAMRTFMTLYFFDAGEFDAGSGYRLNYVKRGADAVVTLTEDDIIEGPEDWEREDSYERPKVLHVAYQNPIADYGAPNISIKRTSPDALVVGERSASVPVVFSDADEITRRADIMMTVIYAEIAGTYEIVLPDSLLALPPTVVIGFSIRGKVRRLRMTGWRYGGGVIRTEWMADRQSCYTSNVSGLPAVATTPPPPSIVGATVGVVLDIPALADSLDTLHQGVAAVGQTEAWWGATQQRKLEADTSFSNVLALNPPGSVIGLTQGTVTAASPHYTDTTNTITVDLYSDDEIETLTQQQFLSEGGAFALSWDDGGVRRWEVMQYRDAVKVGERTWELTYLARGRLNTVAAEHPPGSLFVLLDYGISFMPMQSAWIGTDITHRTVSNGQLPENAASYVEEWTAQCQVEFPVAHLFAEKDGDTLELSCVPRHRFGTEVRPVRSQYWIGYRWTATDGSNAVQVDTLTESTSIDVTGWSTPITVTVAQRNSYTGAGETVSEEVT
ncbi:phage tail protein [Marilutibacter spongiae]|uniref:Tip attachment protein J domain-containing protein n=1 Tax=Marilutibacter spongiae TaxID=2025720 RepID=A0A7W3Y5X3_9GAMM|nr:phage tail protein [Lysobacter spongiae]MBB1060435.1 hypothetical protein [Lysobacter spongiae]